MLSSFLSNSGCSFPKAIKTVSVLTDLLSVSPKTFFGALGVRLWVSSLHASRSLVLALLGRFCSFWGRIRGCGDWGQRFLSWLLTDGDGDDSLSILLVFSALSSEWKSSSFFLGLSLCLLRFFGISFRQSGYHFFGETLSSSTGRHV